MEMSLFSCYIVVYNESKEISYEEVIKFELVNGECIVTLKK